jgi:hypothetical protein
MFTPMPCAERYLQEWQRPEQMTFRSLPCSDAMELLTHEHIKSGLGRMNCPHMVSKLKKLCGACEKPYNPSAFQMSEYCGSFKHTKCPLYLNNIDRIGQNTICS